MPEFRVVGEVRGLQTVYWLQGVFDCQAAAELERTIAHQSTPMILDFSRVTRFVDYGLATFAQRVVGRRDTSGIVLKGLDTHHRRLLHYFGIDVDRQPEAAAPSGESGVADRPTSLRPAAALS